MRLSILVRGRVQGVGYRYFVIRCAQELSLTGWVRNCSNGEVEIEAQGPDRSLVTYAQPNGMGRVIVIALQMGVVMKTETFVRLLNTRQAGEHFLRPGKNISHIVKERKTDIVLEIGDSDIWKAHLQTIQKHSAATYRKSRKRVAGPCLI